MKVTVSNFLYLWIGTRIYVENGVVLVGTYWLLSLVIGEIYEITY